MSETETHFGKIQKVLLPCTLEKWCEEKCNGIGVNEIPSYYDSWEETFRDKFDDHFIINGEVWYMIEHIEATDSELDVMIPNEDKTITFAMQFYNGGTCLSECIEYGLAKLEKEDKI